MWHMVGEVVNYEVNGEAMTGVYAGWKVVDMDECPVFVERDRVAVYIPEYVTVCDGRFLENRPAKLSAQLVSEFHKKLMSEEA